MKASEIHESLLVRAKEDVGQLIGIYRQQPDRFCIPVERGHLEALLTEIERLESILLKKPSDLND